jgi:hypothetical protein
MPGLSVFMPPIPGVKLVPLRQEFGAAAEKPIGWRMQPGTEHRKEDFGMTDTDSAWNREEQLQEDEMNAMIEQLCQSKADEFRLLGYEQVEGKDVWECVSDKYHKTGMPPLYQVVNDILSLKVTQFMNFITLNMYRGDMR